MKAKTIYVKQTSEGQTVKVGFFDETKVKPKKPVEILQVRIYYLKPGEQMEKILPQIKQDLESFVKVRSENKTMSEAYEGKELDLDSVELPKAEVVEPQE